MQCLWRESTLCKHEREGKERNKIDSSVVAFRGHELLSLLRRSYLLPRIDARKLLKVSHYITVPQGKSVAQGEMLLHCCRLFLLPTMNVA